MSAAELAGVTAISCLAIFVQVASGFGLSLVAVPLLSLITDVRTAVVALTFVGLTTNAGQAVHERDHAHRRLALRLAGAATAGFPLGLVVLLAAPERTLKAGLGVAVIVATVALVRSTGEHALPRWVDLAAGGVSGVLSTSVGTNGPPIVLLLRARRLTAPQFRSTIGLVFIWSSTASLVLFAAAGKVDRDVVLTAVAAAPPTILGLFLGARLKAKVTAEAFHGLGIALLVLSGAAALISAARG